MARFEKIDRINVNDITVDSVHVSGGTMSATFTITDKAGQVINLDFRSNERLKAFCDRALTAILKTEWSEQNKYPNAYIDDNSDVYDAKKVQHFAPFNIEPEQDAEPPF